MLLALQLKLAFETGRTLQKKKEKKKEKKKKVQMCFKIQMKTALQTINLSILTFSPSFLFVCLFVCLFVFKILTMDFLLALPIISEDALSFFFFFFFFSTSPLATGFTPDTERKNNIQTFIL
jgi:hypothetical protein